METYSRHRSFSSIISIGLLTECQLSTVPIHRSTPRRHSPLNPHRLHDDRHLFLDCHVSPLFSVSSSLSPPFLFLFNSFKSMIVIEWASRILFLFSSPILFFCVWRRRVAAGQVSVAPSDDHSSLCLLSACCVWCVWIEILRERNGISRSRFSGRCTARHVTLNLTGLIATSVTSKPRFERMEKNVHLYW